MAAASRSLATALWKARVASGSLPQSYTTGRDTTGIFISPRAETPDVEDLN
jgi:hypothetical protein